MRPFDENLFVLDLANNHFGDVKHALKTIAAIADSVTDLNKRVVLKLQLRDLDSYIHPSYLGRNDLHYIKRFSETRLELEEFRTIANAASEAGFLTMATIFDEHSCDTFQDIGFDFAKIASASSNDFHLVSAISELGSPLVASTGGLTQRQIQRLHALLLEQRLEFALMHCVSVYPCPDEILQLRQIQNFKELFPETPVGWSTHESPGNLIAVGLAVALGASLFERHVGLETNRYKLNAYSSGPHVVRDWIGAATDAETMLGSKERLPVTEAERASLLSLKRGVYAASQISPNELLDETKVYKAFPLEEGGLEAGSFDYPLNVNINLSKHDSIPASSVLAQDSDSSEVEEVLSAVQTVIARSRVAVNSEAKLELSHHYGLDRYREFGVAMFTCINRNYAKKILVMLPRQKHPLHYHDMKEETFQLLWGDVQITVNGKNHRLNPGELITVYPKEWHKFSTLNGCVIEEVSTHHTAGDSFYEDQTIASADPAARKTTVANFVFNS